MHLLPESLVASTVEEDSFGNTLAYYHFFPWLHYIFLKSQPVVDEFNDMSFSHGSLEIS